MNRLGIVTVVAGLMLAACGMAMAAEPPSNTPGAWIIYPDGTEHWVGDDRYSSSYGSDLSTSIHNALGYSGSLLYPGSTNSDIGYWENYSPPPVGSIIELRGPGVWTIGGDNAQGGAGREKMKSLVLQQDGITIRGQDYYDAGTGTMVKQQILFNNGATTALFYAEARDLCLENLGIAGTWPTNSGGYAIAVGRYTMIGDEPTAPGLTVTDSNFKGLRGLFDEYGTYASLTLTDNTVSQTYYNLFKKSGTFEGSCVITGNSFTDIGLGQSYADLQIKDNNGSLLIDDNTFDGWKTGQYAIKIEANVSDHPVFLGSGNVFDDQLGGAGMSYELFPLATGGYAVGAVNAESIIPEPATLSLLALGGLAIIRRRRAAK